MSEDLPKQELLIKLLRMSTSPNDGEALIAVRKANELLTSAGWDWEKLIHGKIKVIADPFANVNIPTPQTNGRKAPPPAPPRRPTAAPSNFAAQQAAPPPRQPSPPPPPPQPAKPLSTKDNLYGGFCYCCGDPVGAKAGFIFDPSTKNRSAKSKWQIICNSCNTNRYVNIGGSPAIRRKTILGQATPSLNDI